MMEITESAADSPCAHPHSLILSTLVSAPGGGCVCIISRGPRPFGFWLGSDRGEPWQETGGESEVRVFNLLGSPSVVA